MPGYCLQKFNMHVNFFFKLIFIPAILFWTKEDSSVCHIHFRSKPEHFFFNIQNVTKTWHKWYKRYLLNKDLWLLYLYVHDYNNQHYLTAYGCISYADIFVHLNTLHHTLWYHVSFFYITRTFIISFECVCWEEIMIFISMCLKD